MNKKNYKLATDADFSGCANGDFEYIGTDKYVEIPHVIKGVPVTSYRFMFCGTSVEGVKSTNTNVTDMYYMFAYSQATTLDLSSFDTSKVTDMEWMLESSKATTGYARTITDANKFTTSCSKPKVLNFIVK